MAKELRSGDYIVIQADAISKLGLKGNDLIVFSIIYGFSKDGVNRFTGSLDYLAKWTNSSPRSVMRNLDNLIERNLIEKHEQSLNGVKFCSYNANVYTIDKMSIPSTNCDGGIDKMSNNNILDNKENTIINNSIKEKSKVSSLEDNNVDIVHIEKKRFVKPSIEELEAYCNDKGYKIDCTYFWNYYESKGWLIGKSPMKSWKATLSNWERRGDFNHKPTPKKQPKPDWYDDYKNDIEDKYDYQIDEDGVEIFGGGMLDD